MFAENFNRICAERGTTPTALVKRMGLSSAKVTMWNNGSLPKPEMLVRLAQELQCSVVDFFVEDDSLIARSESDLNEDEQEIIRVYRSLDRRTKHEFMVAVYEYENKENAG